MNMQHTLESPPADDCQRLDDEDRLLDDTPDGIDWDEERHVKPLPQIRWMPRAVRDIERCLAFVG